MSDTDDHSDYYAELETTDEPISDSCSESSDGLEMEDEFKDRRWYRRYYTQMSRDYHQLKHEFELMNAIPYYELIKILLEKVKKLEEENAVLKFGPESKTFERARKHFQKTRQALRKMKPHLWWRS